MVRRLIALAFILALSLVSAACGGSDDGSTGSAATEPAAPSAPAAASTPAEAPAQPVASPSAAAASEPEPASESAPVETPAPASGSASSDPPVDIAAYLSQRTMDFWDAYNTHDLDKLKVFYTEDYWNQQRESIESNMQPFKLFGASITGEETEAPTVIEPGKWRIRHLGKFTLGSVNMLFIYEEFDGEWLLTYAEAQ